MITETGRVVAIEPDALWVETIRRSACNSCVARKGCGQSLLNRIGDGKRNHLRVLLAGKPAEDFQLNDDVRICVPEQILVTGALIVYLLPLLSMIGGMAVADFLLASEAAAALGAVAGFVGGMGLVRLHAWWIRNDSRYQPVVDGLLANRDAENAVTPWRPDVPVDPAQQ